MLFVYLYKHQSALFFIFLVMSLQFIGACKDPLMVIVSELLPGMSLRKYLLAIRPKQLEIHVAINFALDVARAMDCLHANGIIHRDLKPGIAWLAQLYKPLLILTIVIFVE